MVYKQSMSDFPRQIARLCENFRTFAGRFSFENEVNTSKNGLKLSSFFLSCNNQKKKKCFTDTI